MSSFFDRPTKIVPIDDKNSVTIRRLTYGERQSALSAATRATLDENNQETIDIDPGRLSIERMARYIVRWDGPGFDGRLVTRENVEALPTEVADTIARAIGSFDADMGDDEKKESPAA